MQIVPEILKEVLISANSEGVGIIDFTDLKDEHFNLYYDQLKELQLFGIVKWVEDQYDFNPEANSFDKMLNYELTEKGFRCRQDYSFLQQILKSVEGKTTTPLAINTKRLKDVASKKKIPGTFESDFLKTIDEITICADNNCFIATITLSGKVLEYTAKYIISNKINYHPNSTLGQLLPIVRDVLSRENRYFDQNLMKVAEIINYSRNHAIHSSEVVPVPSEDQANMVVAAITDFINRTL